MYRYVSAMHTCGPSARPEKHCMVFNNRMIPIRPLLWSDDEDEEEANIDESMSNNHGIIDAPVEQVKQLVSLNKLLVSQVKSLTTDLRKCEEQVRLWSSVLFVVT